MKFAEIAGQKDIINHIVTNVRNGRISHAQLFAGTEGSGSLAIALAYAQFVNCTDKQYFDDSHEILGDSCGNCPSCLKSKKLIHPDIHFVIPVNDTKSIKKGITRDFLPLWRQFLLEKSPYVTLNQWYEFIEMEKQGIISAEECNEILNTLSYKTYEGEYKIMIIWIIEKLYYSAAPKILKILEEPPDKTLFLMVSNNPGQILDTILSRVQMVKLPRLKTVEISNYLEKHYSGNSQASVKLADKYDNNLATVLEAMSLEDHSARYITQFIEWMRVCYKQDTRLIIEESAKFRELGREKQKQFLQFVITQIRNAWVHHISRNLLHFHDPEQQGFYENFGKYLHSGNIGKIREELEKAVYAIERNGNQRFIFTDTSLKIGNFLRVR
jgi:DNA polymerase III subunit delta'